MLTCENSTGAAGGASASPAAAAFEAACQSLKLAAIALDPSIKAIWVSHICDIDSPQNGLPGAILFDRGSQALAHSRAMRGDA